jgi:cytochrome c
MKPCAVIATVMATLAAAAPASAQLRGHGGPVRAVAVAPDGSAAISGSFDSSAIRWSLTRNAAEQVLRFHESAVNAVAALRDGRIVTAGEDGRIAIWNAGEPQPATVLEGHTAPIAALAVSPDGATARSASGLSQVVRRACSKGTSRTSTASRSRLMGVRW